MNTQKRPTIRCLVSNYWIFLLLVFVSVRPLPLAGKTAAKAENPFFSEFRTPFQVPPFDRIRPEHYLPAFQAGIAQQQKEIAAITESSEPATFANTVETLERSGDLLIKVRKIFNNLLNANTSDALQAVATEVAPLLAKQQDDINMNAKLFARIRAVFDQRDKLDLTAEQGRLLETKYKDFVRGGANLSLARQTELRKINEELSVLELNFSDNVLAETNGFQLIIAKKEDLAGLPTNVIAAAAETAKETGHQGKWVFTPHKPSMIPFLQYAHNRVLREQLFKAYIQRANQGGSHDNKIILTKIAARRAQRAHLLGYTTHADYALELNMAKTPQRVYDFLNRIWLSALPLAKKEAATLQAMIDQEGGNSKLQPWDWFYYAEKLRQAKYALDDEALRPYFALDNVRQGVFDLAHKLYGLKFVEIKSIPKPHPDAKAYEVKEADGRHRGVLYLDFFPRPSKSAGAWQDTYRDECQVAGKKIAPVATMVLNFTRPTAGKPALLSFSEEVTTLFHEFGHALHSLFADCTYRSFSYNVTLDFVELPSQIMENWASEAEMLKMYARHYQSGKPIPVELIEKMKRSSLFNKGFDTIEVLAASLLDMDWHTLISEEPVDAVKFEDVAMARIGLIPEIVVRYKSPYFSHIFCDGYDAGYYSYTWAQVLDADAFEAFRENGLFDAKTASSFRSNILAPYGSVDPMELFRRFRGREPKVEPMLKRLGLLATAEQ